MAISRIKLLIFLGSAIFLGACAQSFSTSSIFIDDTYLTDEFRNQITAEVYEKAEQLGGKCKLVNTQRQYHSCPLMARGPSLELSVGYNPGGNYRIAVTSTYVHWFPPSDQDVTSGKFIGGTQKDLEKWMRSLVPDEAIIRAERTYLDYGVIQEF